MRYLSLLLLLLSFPVSAETVHQGKVVKIADGDTLTLLVDEKQHKIRLSDIDTPERKQPFGTRAKQARIVEVTKDLYRRIVGRVYGVKPLWRRHLEAFQRGSHANDKCSGPNSQLILKQLLTKDLMYRRQAFVLRL